MSQLNEMELQNIRHIAGNHKTIAAKLTDYANQCQDTQIKQMFQQAAQSAQQGVQKLGGFL
ncbi:DUF1657 domain-containing protein [Clostridium bovifaecis]|uniref:DUF1657 domain-containing protein n=1 Tax=Clostridium bovifaecis TaxID=2184719 RepID=A0A6I6FAQ1_9CLOT|nr:DUF1657 domain-containing protein [Clostridium bovifaecis]